MLVFTSKNDISFINARYSSKIVALEIDKLRHEYD